MKLEGFFMSMERSNMVLTKLKEQGFNNSHVEVDNNNGNIQRNLADKDSTVGLSNMIVDSNETGQSPITAISPLINVHGGFNEFKDNEYKVVVEATTGNMQKAKDIIKNMGGKFKDSQIVIGGYTGEIRDTNKRLKDEDIYN
jgi:rhodanese-related sulfurtransferase